MTGGAHLRWRAGRIQRKSKATGKRASDRKADDKPHNPTRRILAQEFGPTGALRHAAGRSRRPDILRPIGVSPLRVIIQENGDPVKAKLLPLAESVNLPAPVRRRVAQRIGDVARYGGGWVRKRGLIGESRIRKFYRKFYSPSRRRASIR